MAPRICSDTAGLLQADRHTISSITRVITSIESTSRSRKRLMASTTWRCICASQMSSFTDGSEVASSTCTSSQFVHMLRSAMKELSLVGSRTWRCFAHHLRGAVVAHSQLLQLHAVVYSESGDVAAAVVEEDAAGGSVMLWSVRHAVSPSDPSHIACCCRSGHVGENVIDYGNNSTEWERIAFSR